MSWHLRSLTFLPFPSPASGALQRIPHRGCRLAGPGKRQRQHEAAHTGALSGEDGYWSWTMVLSQLRVMPLTPCQCPAALELPKSGLKINKEIK